MQLRKDGAGVDPNGQPKQIGFRAATPRIGECLEIDELSYKFGRISAVGN